MNEIILYQSDIAIRLEVLVENETVWLTQTQIASLFSVKVPAVSKHLKNIFESGELQEKSVVSILETTAPDRKRYKTTHATIYTSKISDMLQMDIDKYNKQYPVIFVEQADGIHDRFLIIDDQVYHIGASIKDLGKKLFAFSILSIPADDLLENIRKQESYIP